MIVFATNFLYNEDMKKQIITPDIIIEATISYVAEYGLENVTTKKVALSLGISEGTIFNNFANKRALLTACLYYIDNRIDEALKHVSFHSLSLKKNLRQMWYAYFEYLTAHRAYAKFYFQFRQSSYYTQEVIDGQSRSFSFFTKFIKKNSSLFAFNPDLYWVFVIETTLNFAIRVADKTLPGTPEDIERIYSLLSNGFLGSIRIGKTD